MKKRDLILILCLAVLAFALLGVGLAQRGRLALPAQTAEATAAEQPSEDAQPAAEGESGAEGASDAIPAAVAAYFEEYPAESYLVVTTASGIHSPLPLNEENEFSITQPDGSENVIHIGKNCFYMAASNCDNQLCVHQGEVTLENRDTRILFNMVICLPHDLKLELYSREEAEALLADIYTQTAEAFLGAGGDGN